MKSGIFWGTNRALIVDADRPDWHDDLHRLARKVLVSSSSPFLHPFTCSLLLCHDSFVPIPLLMQKEDVSFFARAYHTLTSKRPSESTPPEIPLTWLRKRTLEGSSPSHPVSLERVVRSRKNYAIGDCTATELHSPDRLLFSSVQETIPLLPKDA